MDELDPRLLRYFVVVAEELSFSRAALRLHISQPPLSYAIKQLEDSLGARLLERTSRRVELTAAGRALYREAQFLLRRHVDVRKLVQRIDAGLHGQIKIGFVGSMLYRRLPEVLKLFQHHYPDIEHVLLELNSAEQIELVERGGLDLGFIHANPVAPPVRALDLVSEPFAICLPAGHPLASKRRLRLDQLAEDDFIFFSRSFSPYYYETLLSMCLQASFYPKVRNEARHWLSVASLVSQGLGVSIVPQCLSRSGMSGLRFLPFDHGHESVCSLIWSEQAASRIHARHIELVRQVYGLDAADSGRKKGGGPRRGGPDAGRLVPPRRPGS
ncbi:LysR family transcriptional regulator [Candidimonas humi]|uniref:LysR substrate-binding domain-containing protein n=1 Tax=Candidimonas humi TaxID=683355 RepID=A0ABV8P3I9_9BURK|nr:LysR family transcriptional regulator [Candidimonas humi]MBV6306492.1 LysR family transcriptional regulator [Candidimonas humi]